GLNSTANTYGLGAGDDGWDWSSGTFDFAGSVAFSGVWNNQLRIETPSTGSGDVSGAYGVQVTITEQQYDMISSNGSAVLYFDYAWDDYQNYFENADQVWVKGRWTSPYSGAHWLGQELDGDHQGADTYPEIAAEDNPNMDIPDGFFSQDLSPWIEGPGTYYLELGGKLERSASNEWGYFLFDNILLVARNVTDHYYFRKEFSVASLDDVKRGAMNLLADDNALVYLNGEIILEDKGRHVGEYWDVRGHIIDQERFVVGTNLLAVELTNAAQSARMDLELYGLSSDRDKVMFVMSDGVANRECLEQGWTDDLDYDGEADEPGDDAIQAACDAAEDYAVVVHAVGFSDEADEEVLSRIAACGNGLFYKSDDVGELVTFYQDVALSILEATRRSQSLVFSSGGDVQQSILYNDSCIIINHSSTYHQPHPNEIELVFQTPQFGACEANITVPQGLRVSDAKVVSYSGEHWTSLVKVDDTTVFNLSVYGENYSAFGDPFSVYIPVEHLTPGEHLISVYTGDDSSNTTNCSFNNSLIYTGFINSSTTRSTVVEKDDGCEWTVEFEDGSFLTFSVPSSYSGTRTCRYTNASYVYDEQEAYDIAVFGLLSQLDFDGDGRVFVNLAAEDLEIIVTLVSDVPYLWGPAIVEVELWQ
ncbi:hypothetical protein JXA12_05400, partial [Candidatus Woesearchaeota archaeon]|nr:hypothetical protein [Candidatus Woesearchaeota archaeon]